MLPITRAAIGVTGAGTTVDCYLIERAFRSRQSQAGTRQGQAGTNRDKAGTSRDKKGQAEIQ